MPLQSIRGQERQVTLLLNAVRHDTLAHAYLFTGIEGIGKKTVALALAKLIHCREGNGDFCDHCSSCMKITRGTHPDILVVEPAGSTIRIDQIRTLQERIAYTVYEGIRTVVIIDEAERMTIQSANCLLKSLEEPPPHTVMVLLTSFPYQLPPTIRSRCQRITFQPLSETVLAELLRGKLQECDHRHIPLIAALAQGSPGRALRFLENDTLEQRQALLEILSSRLGGSMADAATGASLLGNNNQEVPEKLDFIRLWLRDCAVAKLGADSRYTINRDFEQAVRSTADRLSWKALFDTFAGIDEAQSALLDNVGTTLTAEALLVKLFHESNFRRSPVSYRGR